MNITILGRKVSLRDDFKERVHKKLAKFDRVFGDSADAHVTVTVEKNRQTVEITITKDGKFYRSESTKTNMDEALDDVINSLGRQLRKYKTKLSKALKAPSIGEYLIEIGEETEEEQDFKVIRNKKFIVTPLTVDDAILQMNLIGHQFYMFRNIDTDKINVVYKRNDGNYGLIEPEDD